MRNIVTVCVVVGVMALGAYATDPYSTDLGGNGIAVYDVFTNSGGPLEGVIVWDNGVANGINGVRPTPEWDPSGLIDNFSFSAGNSAFNAMRVEMIDGTFPQGTPDTLITAMRLQVFEMPAGGMGALLHGVDAPVFDRTYTRASGDLTVSDSGQDMFNRDLLYLDVLGPAEDLGPGAFVAFVNFPGTGPEDTFWAYSDHPFTGGVDDARVFGPGVNSSFSTPSDLAWTLSIPEPASLALLAFGALALVRRRR